MSTEAIDYVKHGWALVPVARGTKGPTGKGWNERARCITNESDARKLNGSGVGLAHAYSGTCAIDFDDVEEAAKWLRAHDIDATALLGAPEAVRVSSGRPGRAKLLYLLREPLATTQVAEYTDAHGKRHKALEFRSATRNGLTVQDVLPPSVHPDTGRPYEWQYNDELSSSWRFLPEIPESLLALWKSLVARPESPAAESAERVDIEELRALVAQQDPDLDYPGWVRVLSAIHYETWGSPEGLELAVEWSARGKKFEGRRDVEARWRSFSVDHANPVTAASLRKRAAPANADDFEDRTAEPQEKAARAVIQLTPGKLHEYAAQAEQALAGEVYVRERQLVRLGGAPELVEPGVRRDGNQAVILEASSAWVRRRLSTLRQFQRYDRRERKWVVVDCPRDLADHVVSIGDWPELPPLDTIARSPFIRADGTICEMSGYDRASRTFYAANGYFPPVPANPTRDEGSAALTALLAPFEQFPFDTPEARSAFAAAILTEIVRSAVGTVPVFVYSAPTAGTGKSLLAEMPSRIVHGTHPALRPWSSEEELRKTLFASLLAADRTIGFDNLTEGSRVRSSTLCAFATAAVYADRRLGLSERCAMPNRSTVFLTGNNINPAGDLARRSLVIRLDANLESSALRQREFDISDLRGYVADQRSELLVAALVVLMAHRAAGYPSEAVPLPSFEAWSRLVRDALVWLGLPDPVRTQDQEADDDSSALGAAYELIAQAAKEAGQTDFLASDLAGWCLGMNFDTSLSQALLNAGCSQPSDTVRASFWLRGNKGRVAAGWKLTSGSVAHGGARRWCLRPTR